jgi:alpha-mannosidase
LWGRNYSIKGPTDVTYAILPHLGNWSEAGLNMLSDQWNEPVWCEACAAPENGSAWMRSLLSVDSDMFSISSIRIENGNVMAHFFNTSDASANRVVRYSAPCNEIDQLELDGRLVERLPVRLGQPDASAFELKLPKLGVGTIRIVP